MQQQQQIGILLISTGNYKYFVQQLLSGIEQYLFTEHKLNIYLFTDEIIPLEHGSRLSLKQIIIPSYHFPHATLYRYKIFGSRQYSDCDYLFYFDVDMRIVSEIGNDMFGDIVAVRHPGFDKAGGGSWEKRTESKCFTEKRTAYYAGGVQGGKTEKYCLAMRIMETWINMDELNGIIPVWHDESAWNCYLSKLDNFKELDSSYCIPEQINLREQWKISHLSPKIIALEKNHKLIRQ